MKYNNLIDAVLSSVIEIIKTDILCSASPFQKIYQHHQIIQNLLIS